MKEIAWTVDSNFVVKGLGLSGVAQPSNANKAVFSSESTLDTVVSTVHKAADLPYLTINDKVFAARHSVGGVVTPLQQEQTETEPDPVLSPYQ